MTRRLPPSVFIVVGAVLMGALVHFEAWSLVLATGAGLAFVALARTRRQLRRQMRRQLERRVDTGVGARCTEVVLLPLALTIRPGSAVVPVVLVGALFTSCAIRHRGLRPLAAPVVLALGALGAVCALGEIVPLRILVGLGVAAIALSVADRRVVTSSLLDGIGVYLVANVVGYFALGLRSPAQAERLASSLESSFGLFSSRIIFPFTESVVTPPVLAAVFIVGSAPYLLAVPRGRTARFVGLVAAGVVLVGANYRVPLVMAVLIGTALLVWPRTFARLAPVVAVAVLLVPFGYGVVDGFVDRTVAIATQTTPSLSRAGEREGSLNGRTVIWSETLRGQRSFPIRGQLFGYGPGAHERSGVSRSYVRVVGSGVAHPLGTGSHSSALQQLIDGGWVGMLLLVGAVAVTARRLARRSSTHLSDLAALGMVTTLVVSGATESIIAPGTNQAGFAVLVLLGAASAGADGAGRRARLDAPISIRTDSVS